MKKRVTITLDENVVKQAKIKAINEDTNFSATIEKLLKEYLASSENQKETSKNKNEHCDEVIKN